MFPIYHFSVDAVSTVLVEVVDVIDAFFTPEQHDAFFVIDAFLADDEQCASVAVVFSAAVVHSASVREAFLTGVTVVPAAAVDAAVVDAQQDVPFLAEAFFDSSHMAPVVVAETVMPMATAATASIRNFIALSSSEMGT